MEGDVTVTVVVVVGVATVVVDFVTATQEQALEYRTAPEQGEAYAGILDGVTVAWRGAIIASRESSPRAAILIVKIVLVAVTVVTSVVTVAVTVTSEVSTSVTSSVVVAVLSTV